MPGLLQSGSFPLLNLATNQEEGKSTPHTILRCNWFPQTPLTLILNLVVGHSAVYFPSAEVGNYACARLSELWSCSNLTNSKMLNQTTYMHYF